MVTGVVLWVLLAGGTPAREANRVVGPEGVALLRAPDRASLQKGILAIREARWAPGAAPLAQRIRDGLPPDLLALAMDTLAGLPRSAASSVLATLCKHRRPTVRVKAVEGVVTARLPNAQRVLTSALYDPDHEVRRAAALGLGRLGAHGAVPALLAAVGQGVPDAASAVGELAQPDDVSRVLGAIPGLGFDALLPALRTMVGRKDLPVRARVQLVAGLGALPAGVASPFLVQIAGARAGAYPLEIRRAAKEALEARSGEPRR